MKHGPFYLETPIGVLHGLLAHSPGVPSYIFWFICEKNLYHRWASCRFLLTLLGTHVGVFSIKHLLSSNGPLFSFQWSPRFHDTVYLAGS